MKHTRDSPLRRRVPSHLWPPGGETKQPSRKLRAQVQAFTQWMHNEPMSKLQNVQMPNHLTSFGPAEHKAALDAKCLGQNSSRRNLFD